MKTGWACFRFAKIVYVMPVLMAYTHILFTGTPGQNFWAVSSATVGVVAFSILSTTFFLVRMTIFEFLLLALATVLAFIPSPVTMAVAIAIFVAVYFWQRKRADAQLSTDPHAEIAMK